jgi:hypothetical protein
MSHIAEREEPLREMEEPMRMEGGCREMSLKVGRKQLGIIHLILFPWKTKRATG